MSDPRLPQELMDLVVDKVAKNAELDGDLRALRACHRTSFSLCLRSRPYLFKRVSIPKPSCRPAFRSIQNFLDVATPLPSNDRLPRGIARYIQVVWIDAKAATSNLQGRKDIIEATMTLLFDVLHGEDYGPRDLGLWHSPFFRTDVKEYNALRRLLQSPFLRVLRLNHFFCFPIDLLVGSSIQDMYYQQLPKYFHGIRSEAVDDSDLPQLPILRVLDTTHCDGYSLEMFDTPATLSLLLRGLKTLRCSTGQWGSADSELKATPLANACHRTVESLTLVAPQTDSGKWPSRRALDAFFGIPFQNLRVLIFKWDKTGESSFKDQTLQAYCEMINSAACCLARMPEMVIIRGEVTRKRREPYNFGHTGTESFDFRSVDWAILNTLVDPRRPRLPFTLSIRISLNPSSLIGPDRRSFRGQSPALNRRAAEYVATKARRLEFVEPHSLQVQVSGD